MFDRTLRALAVAVALLAAGTALAPANAGDKHWLAIHVDENDPKRMNLALNNAANVSKYYESKGEEVTIEIVAYGPGLHMFRADTSPVKDRLSAMSMEYPNMSFAACGNTHAKMSQAAGKDVELVEEATMVTSGVVRLIELQEQSYAYVRP